MGFSENNVYQFTGPKTEDAHLSVISQARPYQNLTQEQVLPLVWVAGSSSQMFAPYCLFMNFSFLDQNAETPLAEREFPCK